MWGWKRIDTPAWPYRSGQMRDISVWGRGGKEKRDLIPADKRRVNSSSTYLLSASFIIKWYRDNRLGL